MNSRTAKPAPAEKPIRTWTCEAALLGFRKPGPVPSVKVQARTEREAERLAAPLLRCQPNDVVARIAR